MSQHPKGSSHQLLSVIERDPKVLFNMVEKGLKSYGVKFNDVEYYLPNQVNKAESTIEDFVKATSAEFPKVDLNSLYHWWAPVKQKPSWDLISTCNVDGTKGILLVEAKSHHGEMEAGGKTIVVDLSNKVITDEIKFLIKERFKTTALKLNLTAMELGHLMLILNEHSLLDDKLLKSCIEKLRHHDEIGNAISEARGALLHYCDNVSISRDNHYQLSNRIAYTWKLASMGIPTILLYLGFTNDPAWTSAQDHFESKQQWNDAIKSYFTEVGAKDLLDKRRITLDNGISMCFYTWALEAE